MIGDWHDNLPGTTETRISVASGIYGVAIAAQFTAADPAPWRLAMFAAVSIFVCLCTLATIARMIAVYGENTHGRRR